MKEKKPHRSKYISFETARALIREEKISSVHQYWKWHKHNKPTKIPNRPDIIYRRHGWICWNDYLGNQNRFAHIKKNFATYEEAKAFVKPLGLKSKAEWLEWLEKNTRPDNIPARPDFYYKTWFTWTDFLGNPDIETVVKLAKTAFLVLYIAKIPNTPGNVFRVDTTYNAYREPLCNGQDKSTRLIAMFKLDNRDWRAFMRHYGSQYWQGEPNDYVFSNIMQFLYDLEGFFEPFRIAQ
jgi:hypothetical protein